MNADQPVLALKGVSKSFGPVQALSEVDFEVRPGEVVALVGDNGAGKSTLVKTIAGIHTADDGEIRFEGNEVKISSPNDAVDLGIATVYQDLALCDNLDVVENLFLGREEIAEGPARVTRQLDETAMERQTGELLQTLAVTIIDVRSEVERSPGPASAGGDRPLAAGRAQAGDARRAYCRAGRTSDGAGARADQAVARARPGRGGDQPQPGRRVRGGRPRLRAATRSQGRGHRSPRVEPGGGRRGDHRAEFGGNGQRSNEDESTGGEG